ncbi:Uncharacterized protein FWK35_00023527 [Aphis craccivora]|uniref:Uncharacterized protein n=1 Tax=Aphis craccivora TaxID=307492 RepID=A0A6G0Y0V8_APHCR|nr:Uncharacterized protein FWK35_00023527 [Aphis craccivora]
MFYKIISTNIKRYFVKIMIIAYLFLSLSLKLILTMDPMCLYQYNPVNAYVLQSGRRLGPTKGPGCALCNVFRSLAPVLHNYYLNNILFYLVFENTDLGIINYFKKIIIHSWIYYYRTCKDFSNLITLKTLYFSSERSTLEYNSMIW